MVSTDWGNPVVHSWATVADEQKIAYFLSAVCDLGGGRRLPHGGEDMWMCCGELFFC